MKTITAYAFSALTLLILVTACEPNKPKESVKVAKEANDEALDDRDDEKDADFIVNVLASHYAEVKLAELAITRSSNDNVQKMATMLKSDHGKMIAELQGYAAKNGITVPLEETDDAKKEYNNLAEEKELKDFDEKWLDKVADNHEESINYFEKRLKRTEDVELKNWITSALPGLRNHLQTLRANELALNNN